MAWVTTKDGRHVNTEWFDEDKEGKKREHTPLSEQKKSKTSFGKDFQDKVDSYRGKFLSKRSDDEIDEIKKNLDKSTSLVGTTEHDQIAYKAIEDEKNARKNKSKEDISLDKIKSYGYDPADATGDPTVINADGESYYKVGENKWKRHASSGRVLSDSISDEKLAETLKDAKNIKVMPSQKKNAKSLTEQMKEAKNKPDLSSRGTYNLKGEKVPEDLPRVSDEEAKQNKQIEYDGTTYSTQQVVDYDKSQGGEYVAGHMYVPHHDLNKGSFFVSKDGEMYHSGSDYLNAKAKKSLTEQMKEANNEKPKREHEFKKKETTAPAKISDKSRKVADNARKSLIWDNGRDYVEIAKNQWQWAGMSNEAVVKALNATDDKYTYEYKQDQSTGAFMMPNAKVNHYKIYRKKKK